MTRYQSHSTLLSACLVVVCMCLAVVVRPSLAAPQSVPTQPVFANPASVAKNDIDQANQELLKANALLEQKNNTLQTEVNVLIAERNNQLFMYGALTMLVGVLAGFIAAWLLLGRKQNW